MDEHGQFVRWIILNYLLNMLILHSYVKLPEGTSQLAGKEKDQ